MTTTLPSTADKPADVEIVRIMRTGEPEYYPGGLTLVQAAYATPWNSPGQAVKNLVEGAQYCHLQFDGRSDYTNEGAQFTDIFCELSDPDDGTGRELLVRVVRL